MRSSAVAVCTVLFGAEAIAQQESTTLPAVDVKASQYDADDVRPEGVTTATKNYLAPKDIPQTMDTLDVNKYKSYGINDLSIMLDGIPGVSTNYDMRGEGVMIRGFSADSGDIYRDGVRESGQVRRSTANVERNPAELRLAADQQQDHVEHAGPDRQVQDRPRGARPAGGPGRQRAAAPPQGLRHGAGHLHLRPAQSEHQRLAGPAGARGAHTEQPPQGRGRGAVCAGPDQPHTAMEAAGRPAP
jgi:hypothetical protein